MAQKLFREFRLALSDPDADEDDDERPGDGDDDVIPATIASDRPIIRGGFDGPYNEVLSHAPGAINFERAPLPLLEGHDASVANLGRVDNLRVENGKLRGDIRLGQSARARDLAADIRSGIVSGVSVGYTIDSSEWNDAGDTLTASRWTPMEASIVAVPADTSAGFYRSKPMNDGNIDRSPSRSQRRAERVAADSESSRAAEIAQLAQTHGMGHRTAAWISSGVSLDEVRAEILDARRTAPMRMPSSEQLDRSMGQQNMRIDNEIPAEEIRKYSLLRAIRAAMPGADASAKREAGLEIEMSSLLYQQRDREPKGLMVPDAVLFGARGMSMRGMTVGTATAGGDLVATNLLAGEYIESLHNQPQVVNLGARTLSGLVGNVAIPRLTAGDAVHWITEGADYGDTQPTFDQPQMVPHDLSARVDISRRLLIQSTPNADEIVRNDLVLRLGIGIDAAAISGAGTSGQPLGILSTSGVGSVPLGTNGAAPTWNSMTEMIETLAQANGLRGNLGWLTNGSVQGTLMRTPMVTGFPRFVWEAGMPGARPDEGVIAGYRALVSNNVPNSLTKGSGTGLSAMIFGNWNDLLIGTWKGLDMVIDPYSQSATGTLRITIIQTLDILVRHAASFCTITDAVTT